MEQTLRKRPLKLVVGVTFVKTPMVVKENFVNDKTLDKICPDPRSPIANVI
jgi:hypothetical protein